MNFYPSKEQAFALSKNKNYKSLPLAMKEKCHTTETEIYKILKNISHNVFILDSAEKNSPHGRYTFLGFDPSLELTCRNGCVRLRSATELHFDNSDPKFYIRKILSENKSPKLPELPPFTGGLVGYFAFDFIKYSEPQLDFDIFDEENFCDVDLMLFDKIIAVDNEKEELIYIVNIKTDDFETNYNKAVMDLKSMSVLIREGEPKIEEKGKLTEPLSPLFDEKAYCQMVENAKKRIFEGDIFQVVLSNRLAANYQGSLFYTYCKLRSSNPSPYMFYFSSDDVEIAGASPETLVKLENNIVTTYPLAGTRPRGKTPEEDIALEKELLSDEKELAEHNMLVDLGRNDIGKISKFGSVKVDKYMNIERYSHVMHIGSAVSGELRNDLDALDAVSAVLPAGTLSGAPKIKACEIISESENNKRGIYGGAIGYLAFNGDMDTCIAIRLAFKKNGKVFVRSGAGIVADSVPENEYKECINKAKAVVNALEEV
ncbi:MAG: anthranilate synthase component I family protein [Clostridia bacterium]|nr:anthranilate synthase component I family protein [Clostridia bacterium]